MTPKRVGKTEQVLTASQSDHSKVYAPSVAVYCRWLLEASEDVHKTKKLGLGINGHINISEGHQLPM